MHTVLYATGQLISILGPFKDSLTRNVLCHQCFTTVHKEDLKNSIYTIHYGNFESDGTYGPLFNLSWFTNTIAEYRSLGSSIKYYTELVIRIFIQ